MNMLIVGAAALPLMMGVASGAETLTDAQLDQISAGALGGDLSAILCPICITSSSIATSMTTNGVTVTTRAANSSSGSGGSTGGSGGSTGGGGGSTGGSGGSTGGGGGSTGGSGGSTGGNGGSPGGTSPAVPSVTLPGNLVSVITASTGFAPALH